MQRQVHVSLFGLVSVFAFFCALSASVPGVCAREDGAKKKADEKDTKKERAPAKRSGAKKSPAQSFTVVRIGTELKVLGKSELDEARKKVAAEYKEAVKAYNEAKREAAKNKERFTGKRPRQARITVVRSGLASREKAEEELNRIGERENGSKTDKSSSFAIVRIADEVRVVASAELVSMKADLDKEYKEGLEKYREDQREAAKRGERFTGKPPVRKTFKVLASRVATKEKAEALKEKLGGKSSKKKPGAKSS